MGGTSGIEWTDATWNPVSGCMKVSDGCKNCYAERLFPRAYASAAAAGRKFTDVVLHHDRLGIPLQWRRKRMVFVNSMSDLFHADVPDEFIERALTTTAHAQHVFQILTKRPERMREVMRRWTDMNGRPQPNLWLGVSVEDQATANARIPLLLQTPAAVRFVSAEPLLGPVDVTNYLRPFVVRQASNGLNEKLDWVVVGGESGRKARPCNVAWIRSIKDQCMAAGVPVFVKQLGARPYDGEEPDHDPNGADEPRWMHLKDRKGGDMEEWPLDLRVREYP